MSSHGVNNLLAGNLLDEYYNKIISENTIHIKYSDIYI